MLSSPRGQGRAREQLVGDSTRRALPSEAIWHPEGVWAEFGTLEAIFGCVSAGLGITMMPRALLGGVCAVGRVSAHALPPADAMVETVFIRRRGGFASSALNAFLACAAGGFATTEAA